MVQDVSRLGRQEPLERAERVRHAALGRGGGAESLEIKSGVLAAVFGGLLVPHLAAARSVGNALA